MKTFKQYLTDNGDASVEMTPVNEGDLFKDRVPDATTHDWDLLATAYQQMQHPGIKEATKAFLMNTVRPMMTYTKNPT